MAPKSKQRGNARGQKSSKRVKTKEEFRGRIVFSVMGFYGFSICTYISSQINHGFMYQINLNIFFCHKAKHKWNLKCGDLFLFVFISLQYQLYAI